MKYLFIDTSTHDLTVAISSTDEIFSIGSSNNTNQHSKYALPILEKVFNESKLTPNEIDKILVVNGPGSFTGVRIGVTIAKTYAWSLNKDVIPISSLLAHALFYDGFDYYVSILDARRDNVYAAIYNNKYEVFLEEQHISIINLNKVVSSLEGNIIVIGDLDIENYDVFPIKIDVLKIINYYKGEQAVPAHSLKPRYLKLVEAEEKLGVLKE